jgi:ATP synthase F0 subunit b
LIGVGIFIGQLIGFAVIVWVIMRYIAPPVRTLMAKQQDEVRTQIGEAEKAEARLAEAKKAHAEAVAQAQSEAAQIREDARADAQRIAAQLREQADVEVARIKQHGVEQIALQRQQLIRQLQADLGSAAVKDADQLVRQRLAQPGAQSNTVDRFLDELEAMAGDKSNGEGS